jgi:hypothetical protein
MKFNPETAKPAEVVSYLSEAIRKSHGDKVQNAASVSAVKGGSYVVAFKIGDEPYEFKFRRKSAKKIAKVIRALKTDPE